MALRGFKNLEIAEELRISVETVNKHLDKVYRKAKVNGRSQLAALLIIADLHDTPYDEIQKCAGLAAPEITRAFLETSGLRIMP